MHEPSFGEHWDPGIQQGTMVGDTAFSGTDERDGCQFKTIARRACGGCCWLSCREGTTRAHACRLWSGFSIMTFSKHQYHRYANVNQPFPNLPNNECSLHEGKRVPCVGRRSLDCHPCFSCCIIVLFPLFCCFLI